MNGLLPRLLSSHSPTSALRSCVVAARGAVSHPVWSLPGGLSVADPWRSAASPLSRPRLSASFCNVTRPPRHSPSYSSSLPHLRPSGTLGTTAYRLTTVPSAAPHRRPLSNLGKTRYSGRTSPETGKDRQALTESRPVSVPNLGAPLNDLKLRCTIFDQQGNVTTIAGEFSKSELCAQHGLQVRDLRKIDSLYVNQLPAILVRKEAILVNISHIRALIKADMVVLFDSFGSTDSYNQSIFVYDLQEKLRLAGSSNSAGKSGGPPLPFEFRALESVLVSVVSTLQDEVQVVSNLVTNLLAHLEEHIDRHKLKELLQYSKRMAKFEQKVLNIRDAIVEVLEQDEDLAAMYLTSKLKDRPRETNDHEEVELLLETYLKQVEETANIISALSTNMRSTEDIVNIMLDSQRNSFMLLELQVNIGMFGLTAGALVAGIFGMNLANHHEAHPFAFIMVSTAIFTIAAALILLSVRRMRRLLRKI